MTIRENFEHLRRKKKSFAKITEIRVPQWDWSKKMV